MTRPATCALLLALAASPALADEPEAGAGAWRPAGEVVAGGLIGSIHGLTLRGIAFRAGLGGHQAGGWPGHPDSDLAAMLVVGGLVARTPAGLHATEWRAGLAARARLGRLLLGADAELVRLDVERVSTSGHLRGTGVGVRVLVGWELVRLGRAALFAEAEGVLDELAPFTSKAFLPAAQLGVGLRW